MQPEEGLWTKQHDQRSCFPTRQLLSNNIQGIVGSHYSPILVRTGFVAGKCNRVKSKDVLILFLKGWSRMPDAVDSVFVVSYFWII